MKIVIIPIVLIALAGSAVFVLSQRSNTSRSINQESITQNQGSQNTPMECSGNPLPELTEGPYYKSDSPERQKIMEANTPGEHLILKGYVLNTNCEPIANAWLDFWQADGEGNYDNTGYNLRGHQYTDSSGYFSLETVVPIRYSGRTEHIHFKVRKSGNSPVITSQLFFPESITNTTDSIFDESLVVEYGKNPDGSNYALYNIIVP